jgi:exopolysaccharide biosynthesis protein
MTIVYLVISSVGRANTLSSAPAFHSQSWVPQMAQALPLPLTQQGNQIILNGRPLAVPWSQRQQSIGITDAGLSQLAGVDLLNTNVPSQQPVQWFSEPNTNPLVLPTWFTSQYRYLDITDLTQRAGWQVQASGSTLQITTPNSNLLAIRQGKQSWGDRIVLDLNQPTPWQVTQARGEFIISIDAQANPALLQSFIPTQGNRLTSLKVEANGNQVRIRVGVPSGLQPHVWTLPNPNRLVIDVLTTSMMERNVLWAPGIRWQQQIVNTGRAQFPVVTLLIDPRQPGLSIKPIWANPATSVGTAPLSTIAQRWQAAAAINGGFFNRNNQLPLGAVRQDNRWVSGPILNRGAIAWNQSGEVKVGRLSLQETITTATGQQIPVILFNTGYVRAGLARYTTEWGSTYTNIIDNEVLITVRNNQVISQTPSGAQGQTTIPIPADGYILVARSFNTAVNGLPIGSTLGHDVSTVPADFSQYPHILGAGPVLLQNRQVVLNPQTEQFTTAFIREAAIRSAIGTTPDGNLAIVTVQNRIGGSGPTLGEMAQIMQQLGTVDALNLDGGSSTTLYLGGQLLNRTPFTAARVHNGIGIFVEPRF